MNKSQIILFVTLILLLLALALAFSYGAEEEIIIEAGDQVNILVQGIKGEKGEEGNQGPMGPQGPPGQGGNGGICQDIWVNVKENGAKGDGKHDDTVAIQKLLTELPATSVLKFPMGIYKISDTLQDDKNISIVGSGSGTKIYQSEDKTLLRVTSPGKVLVSDLWLASVAKSPGTSLILLEPNTEKGTPAPSHIELRDIHISGGGDGICMRGVLFPRLDNIKQSTAWAPASYPVSIGKAGIYAEYAGRAPNSITVINPIFQGGYDRAIWIKAARETGLTIIGGCLEAMKEAAIVCDGIAHYTNIIGTHFEGTQGTIQLNGCQQVNIQGVLGIGDAGIILKGCRRAGLEQVYGWNIDIDGSNRNLIMHNILYKTLELGAQMVEARNFNCTDNPSLGPFGTYTSDLPQNIDELTNGSLESWTEAGKPIGFSVYGSIQKETDIVYEGQKAARVSWSVIGGLRFDVPMKYIRQGGVITAYLMCYKPENGFNPRLTAIYNNWAAVTAFPVIEIPTEEWVIARATFNVPPGMSSMFIIMPSGYAPGKEGQALVIDWIRVAASH